MTKAMQADAVVVGSGQAAPALCVALAQRGEKVVLIEGAQVGGSCVNYGCTPTKTLRKSARVAYLARRAAEFGVHLGKVEVDFAAAMNRMQSRVDTSRGGLESWIGGEPNITLLRAWGSFVGGEEGAFDLLAGEQPVRAKRVYLNTGTRAFIPPIPGLDQVPYLDNVSLLKLRERPRHLIVIGGSYIGLEMGQIFRRLGSEVTVIETGPRITSREDEEVSACIASFLEEEGINIVAGLPVTRVARSGDGVVVELGARKVEGSHVLVATGRLPNTEKLNLQAVGVDMDARGFVPTNARLETNVPGIWALGDINKRGAFTHTSYHDYEIAIANHDGGHRSADDRIMAYAMFTDPPLGRVGMSEAEARASGRNILMATFDMKNVSRAKEEGETTGLVKMLVDADTDQFVGATLVGINADEIIQVISNFMAAGASWRVMKDALPVHPTVTEFFPTILGKLRPLAG
ncbi:mercuric reductase [Caenimonas koreensis DSM 17982]|uniref:Mercuric reductase n=1 Tax=Caenimonas koreensis DSM 17982 TaxID=1121255 RepID=A0A844B0B6_9BURK|nr:mercuric reductase [Caenimonas koreensis]MRD46553.1 mercuric reductase [Caenimonas koreensis DSM 17982]